MLLHRSGGLARMRAHTPGVRFLAALPNAPLSQPGGVHGQAKPSEKLWRRKPLFRRGGEDVTFKSGAEAANLLVEEAKRRDGDQERFIETYQGFVLTLAPLFDRMPKYAWIAKQIAEPERYIEFRCAWIDDTGVSRVNRGYRVQYSSALGPYEGSLMFGHQVNTAMMKSLGFDTIMTNALVGGVGGACGGADFDPSG
uniref:Glutamate/phenylalanine/leucine/valine/L-tryptophan dehydrogenase dimerisation domain-containing protein n=3 Tax=Phaeomonas parva TaxID=124430 RepID=A0A7S1U2J0_9STRA|mmetsp:Transcript_28181/g.90082  ORF Transcript_28181/g.90082 Transcript_28181/m.90082 type:complete len:197 (+) Transcript_28181:289-879(+)